MVRGVQEVPRKSLKPLFKGRGSAMSREGRRGRGSVFLSREERRQGSRCWTRLPKPGWGRGSGKDWLQGPVGQGAVNWGCCTG